MPTLQDIKSEFRKFIYLLDDHIIDVTLAVIVANRMPGDSVSLYIIGPSSSAKTEVVRALESYQHAHHISKITPNTLLSGYQEQGLKKENVSLLLKLQREGKNILIFKDFTTVLSMRHDDRMEIMSQVRELADGYISANYGNQQHVEFKGNMGIIACCTNAIDEYSSANEVLGERFLKYRVSAEMARDIAEMASRHAIDKDTMRNGVSTLMCAFLANFDLVLHIPDIEPVVHSKLIDLCYLSAHLRSQIIKEKYSQLIITPVVHEGPGRLASALAKLAKALMLVQGKDTTDNEIYGILKKIIRDTLPSYRHLILEKVYESGQITIPELAQKLRISYKEARKYCEDLLRIRILKRDQDPHTQKDRFIWSIDTSSPYIDLIEKSEIFVLDKF